MRQLSYLYPWSPGYGALNFEGHSLDFVYKSWLALILVDASRMVGFGNTRSFLPWGSTFLGGCTGFR